MKKIIVPPYKYDIKENVVVDRYICSKCCKIVKEAKRTLESRRKSRVNSMIYYIICSQCSNKKILKFKNKKLLK